MVNNFFDLEYDPTAIVIIINTVLAFKTKHNETFNKLVRKCLTSSCGELSEKVFLNPTQEDINTIFKIYLERRVEIETAYGLRLETFIENYIQHYLFRKSYVQFPSLISYIRNLLIHINVIKFLFVLNPLLTPLVDKKSLSEEDANVAMDKAIVETVSVCARAFDHQHTRILDIINKTLDGNNFDKIERLTMLART